MRLPTGSAIGRIASNLRVLVVFSISIGFLAAPNKAIAQSAALPGSCLVTTMNGPLQGLDLGTTCGFFGIPYAAPPLGNLRWKPPQPKAPWAPAILTVTTPPSNCPAINAAGMPVGSEDCLKLNIWAPKQLLIDPAPVIVWLHTGGFVAASANFAGNNGQKIAEQKGVIVVAPNYRLGPLGFLAHTALTAENPDYSSSGNYGFLDQRAAMSWVRDNVAAFGGNPHNVTIGGQSAGSHSVSLHLVSPASGGLFHSAIMQSGYASTRWKTRPEAEAQGNRLAAALGCVDPSQVLSCLRLKTASQLLTALPGGGRDQILETASVQWNPVVDGLEIPDQPRLQYERGAFNRVPILLGATKDDGWVFVERSFPGEVTEAQYESTLETEFGPYAQEFLTQYPLLLFPTPKDALSQIATDVEYVCEAVRIAHLIERTGTPVYLYSFEYVVDGIGSNRSIHGLDTNLVFGNNYVANFPAPHTLNAADLALYGAMSGYFTLFAATGKPNADDESIVHWTEFKSPTGAGRGSGKYIIFDSTIAEGKRVREQQCGFGERFFYRSIAGTVPAVTP
jgi:para-nitrobenzyl esterase